MATRETSSSTFAGSALPGCVAVGALALYGVTLNHWVTLASLPVAAKATGWDWWTPTIQAPLYWLSTKLASWLPAGGQLLALNLFSAVCAALTLGLLARSVALLPHDRTREQRQRERSEDSRLSLRANWLPPLLAVLVCGLQSTFWENATVATGEAFNLLLFAYVIRCLLEYRCQGRDSWLRRAAFAYSLGLTNNWALLGFLPLFLLVLIWVKGRGFFKLRFLVQMAGIGLAGLTLYLLLPILGSLADQAPLSFEQLLRMQLGLQKNSLLAIPRWVVLILSMTSLVPFLTLFIRWPSSFADTSAIGAALTNFMFRVVHGVFLVVCLWAAFDPPYSPRVVGMGVPFLTFYYLGALCVGYYSGYFLLVFGQGTGNAWQHPPLWERALNGLLVAAVWVALFAAPAALVWQNLPRIQAANGPSLRRYAELTAQGLPAQGVTVLSDNPLLLLLVEAHHHASKAPHAHLLIDLRSLPFPSYQRALGAHYPQRWPDLLAGRVVPGPINPATISGMITQLAASRAVYYLHPIYGHQHLERLYLQPHGLVYELKSYPPATVTAPPLGAEELAANEALWTSVGAELPGLRRHLENKLGDGAVVGSLYSRAANHWGAELQRHDRIPEAGKAFELALDLHRENLAAAVNQDFNRRWQRGEPRAAQIGKSLADQFDRYRTWAELLGADGPFDEPEFCFQLGRTFARFNLVRQAAVQFTRAQTLEPGNFNYRFALAEMYLRGRAPDLALQAVGDLRLLLSPRATNLVSQTGLLRLEASAYFQKTNFTLAEKLLLDARKNIPNDAAVLQTLSEIYLVSGRYTNALSVVEAQLRLDPKNLRALLNLGGTLIQLQRFEQALDPLEAALKLEPENLAALLNRALTRLNLNQLDHAQRDYETLRKLLPPAESYKAWFGLGRVAHQRKQIPEAIRCYEEGLRFALPDSPDAKSARNRLQEFQSGAK